MKFLLNEINTACSANWNGILVNFYHNYISAHSDDEKELDTTAGVVALSIGATRTFRIRSKASLSILDVELKSGDLVQMCGPLFQHLLSHEIVKTKKLCGWRLSVTCHKHKVRHV